MTTRRMTEETPSGGRLGSLRKRFPWSGLALLVLLLGVGC